MPSADSSIIKGAFIAIALASTLLVACTSTAIHRQVASDPEDKFEVTASEDSTTEEVTGLKRDLREAIAEFETRLAPLADRRIKASIGAEGCLRVGYSFSEKTVRFCATRDVIGKGLASRDVVRHETFHALTCALRPDWCAKETLSESESVAIHEAMADFFAHSLEPDDCFGENYYRDRNCTRSYRTSLCYSLVDGSHEKGNALAALFIDSRLTVKDLRRYFASGELKLVSLLEALKLPANGCFAGAQAPQVTVKVAGYPPSKLNKYWLKPDVPLELEFVPNGATSRKYPALSVKIIQADDTTATSFKIDALSALTYRLSTTGEAAAEKLIALYLDGETVVGSKALYIGARESGEE